MKIGLLGSKGTTLDFLAGFEAETGHQITHLITLAEGKASSKVSFYAADALKSAAEGRITHEARSYTLTAEEDRAFFSNAGLDVLFVLGWERLLPVDVLKMVRCGAYGMHGSPFGLPLGRGRSPMNWAILQGHVQFVTSLFRYSDGIDDGDIVGSKVFTISPRDDIGTLHLKIRLAMLKLAGLHLADILDGTAVHTVQPALTPTFYPKRTAEDGAIGWSASTQEIDRLVRAVAPPYPGAFTFLDGARLVIETARPFEAAFFPSTVPAGTILDVSPSMEAFVVKTGDGSLFVTRFSGAKISEIRRGDVLRSDAVKWTSELLSERYGPGQAPDAWEVRPS